MYPQRFEDHRHLGLLLLAAVCLFVPFELALAHGSGQRWAVLVGVNEYTELGNLRYCVADVRALRGRLVAAGFPAENIFLLADGAAEADAQGNRDGSVSMLELFGYANRQTRRWVRHNRPGSSQTPELHGRIPADFQLGERSPAAQSPPLPVAPFTASTQQEVWAKHLGQPVEITNSIGMKLTLIPPGEFMMGSPASEAVRHDDEAQHRVRLTKPYYLGMYEVTQGEYERVIGTNPSAFARSGDSSERVSGQDTSRFPVERVSWVGSYASNGFGLFDMHGNVREWCSDWYDSGYYANSPTDDPTGLTSGSFRVFRGGGWFSDARSCRSAFRYGLPPSIRINSLGFRLAFSSVDQSGR